MGCESLNNVSLPNNLEIIPEGMFNGCSDHLDEINIPFSVTQIGSLAFANGLSGINISSNISNISADAFTGTCLDSKFNSGQIRGPISYSSCQYNSTTVVPTTVRPIVTFPLYVKKE